MTKFVVDAAFQAKLDNLQEPVEFCDQSGRTLGFFHPMIGSSDSGGATVQSPFTDEEIQRRRQPRSGRPLGEILDRLQRIQVE